MFYCDSSSLPNSITDSTADTTLDTTVEPTSRVRKHQFLPQRSLLIISGPARYQWSHGIAPRKHDTFPDRGMIPRSRRISFTFRHVLRPGQIPSDAIRSGEMEQEHVVEVYDAIAKHWHHTRGLRKVHWQRVKEFILALPNASFIADVGSGDGKYFNLHPNSVVIGCDRSEQLLAVSKESSHETFACDAVTLPLRSSTFDAVLCIAVLHHLATVDRRVAAIRELLRICVDGGSVFIQAWALEQGPDSKHVFETQDTMVPWKLNKRFIHDKNNKTIGEKKKEMDKKEQDELIVYERYCHVYKEGELEDLCSQAAGCEIIESGWDRGNWFVHLKKVKDERLVAAGSGPESSLPFRKLHAL